MKIIFKKNIIKKIANKEKKMGFVPTMGCIHSGHISLIQKASKECEKVIVSIFINKPQFNRKSDFLKYPRILKKDIKILRKNNVNFLYLPSNKSIYPEGPNKKIKIDSFSKRLCGKNRPGHFEAVVDVLERFLKIINPKKIYLGKKDFQQLKIVENFLYKKYPNINVIPCNTIREKNGIAYSSRNILLSKVQKKIASKVYKNLKNSKNKLLKNKLSLKKITKILYELGITKIDYIKIININKVIKPFGKRNNYKIFISYYLGSTRLIDNI